MHEKKNSINVVLVDDDAEDREFFQEVVEELPYEVALTTYKNGQEFIDGLIQNKDLLPDLVFLDLNMPIKNGIQSLKEVRQMEEFKKIPIIAIYSTSISPEDKADTFHLGADAYISKPNDYRELKMLISKIFEMDWKNRSTNKANFIITPI